MSSQDRYDQNDPVIVAILKSNKSASRKDNEELYKRVVKGDKQAREEMINRNVALVVFKVDRYLDEFPMFEYLRDELLSEGFVGLCRAANRMAEGGEVTGVTNPTGLLNTWILHSIGEVIDGESSNGLSPRSVRRLRKKGVHVAESIEDDVALESKSNEHDPAALVDLRDTLTACCETEYDHAIIDLRERGFSDREIGIELDLPTTTAYMMRRELYDRFLERSGLPGEV